MATLPYNRVVNVTLSREDSFPSRRGFGTSIVLTTGSVVGELDATHLTKLYASMEEVATDWLTTDEFYLAALSAFSRKPRPLQIKAGYIPLTSAFDEAAMTATLDALYAADNEWYFVTIGSSLRDLPALDGLISWTQAKNKLAIIDTNDILHETAADTTCVSARNKNLFDRTGTFYHTDATMYPAISLASYMATRNFDDADSAYTAKFKELPGISPVNLPSAKLTAVTGFTPGIGQNITQGHIANTYIDIGQQFFTVEGSTLTQNVFLDEIHVTDWMIARTEEESLALLLNNDRIPFTDAGMELVASAARTVLRAAARAGLIAEDLDDEGNYSLAAEVIVPSVFDVTASQRKARIAPAVTVRFRYAGAVHYTTINYTMTF